MLIKFILVIISGEIYMYKKLGLGQRNGLGEEGANTQRTSRLISRSKPEQGTLET